MTFTSLATRVPSSLGALTDDAIGVGDEPAPSANAADFVLSDVGDHQDASAEFLGKALEVAQYRTHVLGGVLVRARNRCAERVDDDHAEADVPPPGKAGDVRQFTVTAKDGKPSLALTRSFAVGSQAEGCVIDDAAGVLFVAEEAKGIWRYALDPATGAARAPLAPAPSQMLKPDVEGLTLLREGAAIWLLASSQGDSAFAVWRVDGAPTYAGRFSVVPGSGAGAVTGTDGLAALGGPVGAFPEGLVVVQDDADTDGETTAGTRVRQNFKLVDWRAVKAALAMR